MGPNSASYKEKMYTYLYIDKMYTSQAAIYNQDSLFITYRIVPSSIYDINTRGRLSKPLFLDSYVKRTQVT